MTESKESESVFIRELPHLWARTVALATSTTGMLYLPKLPGPNGEIWACYSGPYVPFVPPKPKTKEELRKEQLEREREEIEEAEEDLERRQDEIERRKEDIVADEEQLRQDRAHWEERRVENDKKRGIAQAGAIFVPDGAMEWLLHEAGHWLAATPEERSCHNYGLTPSLHGHDGDREWQAWAFEEIVLAPWGPSRLFAPPSQREGAAFKSGPIAPRYLRHVDRRIKEDRIDIAEWRALYGEWVRWGLTKGVRPWDKEN